jgi:F1F0 ATPase subunit 2
MTMAEALTLLLSWAAGGLLGAVFFGGLWWTVRRGVSSDRPALWFLGSVVVRTSVTLSGFYVVSGRHPERLVSCLVGFVTARLVARWLARPSGTGRPSLAREVGDAP